jgi:hypothetical protein
MAKRACAGNDYQQVRPFLLQLLHGGDEVAKTHSLHKTADGQNNRAIGWPLETLTCFDARRFDVEARRFQAAGNYVNEVGIDLVFGGKQLPKCL